jgi:putative NIF3 family GTP cyclohydrolase 1 type 2
MVITHEPTFFSHRDEVEPVRQDPVYLHKREFLDSRRMVVFHFHDHWHARRPDGIAVGMARELGWEKHADPSDPKRFVLPEVRLDALAGHMAARLGIRAMRVVGDPGLRVRRVLASWGYVGQPGGISSFARPDVDAFVVGETWEWELVEYAQDAIAAGRKKALIILGHALSEQAGMKYCAEWLREFIPEVPVEYLPLAEPYWRPSQAG